MLSDRGIYAALQNHDLEIKRRADKRWVGAVNSASIDLTLGTQVAKMPSTKGRVIDLKEDNSKLMDTVDCPDGYIIEPGEFMLAHTDETVRLSNRLAAQVEGKSSLARLGLMVHVTAGFIDPGFSGEITLELKNVNIWPIKVYPLMPICQLALFGLDTPCMYSYGSKYGPSTGPMAYKYQDQTGPQQSRYHINFGTPDD